jgi:hypothetical protein
MSIKKNSSTAEEVKEFFEVNKDKVISWKDIKNNMGLDGSKIADETCAENDSVRVIFNDDSSLYIDNPSGASGFISVVLLP